MSGDEFRPKGSDPVALVKDGPHTTRRRALLGGAAVAGGLGLAALGRPAAALAATGATDWLNVKADYGATGNGSTDDTTAVQNALTAAASGGGVVYFPPGTYAVGQLNVSTGVLLRGAGTEASVIKLRSGKNSDLIRTTGYTTPTTQERFGFMDLALDGNKSGNASGGAGLRLYGKSYVLDNVDIANCKGDGIDSSWAAGGDDMEADLRSFKIRNCDGNGITWGGPHDSVFSDFQIFNSGANSGGYGYYATTNGAGSQMVNGHIWGNHTYCYYLDENAYLANCIGEGASTAQMIINAPDTAAVTSVFFCPDDAGSGVGIQLTSSGNFISRTMLDVRIGNCPTAAIAFTTGYELLSYIRATVQLPGTGTPAVYTGTPHDSSVVMISVDDGTFDPSSNLMQLPAKIGFFGTSPQAQGTGWSTSGTSSNKTITGSSTTTDVRNALATLIGQLKTYGLLGP